MTCPKCGAEMHIEAWYGWVWMCAFCDHVGRNSTYEEWEEYVSKQEETFKKVYGWYK